MRVLIVDASGPVRGVLACALDDFGFEICEADSGAAAVARLRDETPDIVLAEPHGLSVAEAALLKAATRQADTPVVVLSTDDRSASMADGYGVGAASWMIKPADIDHLADQLRAAG